MELQRIAREWVIYGRVQGVGFRAFAAQRARLLGVAGWVANRRDGAVVVVAEGSAEAMRAFEAHLGRGPTTARVDRMDETDRASEGYADFQIFPTKEEL
jgi:acylphosphatase